MTAGREPDRPESGSSGGPDEDRLRTVILGVVDAALRDRGAGAVVLTGPETPERRLLVRWLGARAVLPEEEGVASVRRALATAKPGLPAAVVDEEARRAVARARAASDGLLCASALHKTALVLGSGLPPEPLLPLGDVWASEVAGVEGSCTVPAVLDGLEPGALGPVDRALRAHLEEGLAREDALAPLDPDVRRRISDALAGRPWGRFRTPLVPKLGLRTVGLDLE